MTMLARTLMAGLLLAGADAFQQPRSFARPARRARQTTQVNMLDVSDPTVLAGGGVAALVVATHPIWLTALGLKKPKEPVLGGGGGSVDDITEVREYFNTVGFDRWNKIYSDSDEVNKVQLDIRDGHQVTIDTALEWLAEGSLDGKTVCDLGCGVGSLAIPMAKQGAVVSASDISKAMATEAARRAEEQGIKTAQFEANDLESVSGEYDLVTCIDVMIHYPTDKMTDMVQHIGGLSSDRLLVSFAPKTLAYSLLKKIGSLFPGPSKTTRAYLHPEADVRAALEKAGFKVTRSKLTATNFYFSTLLEASRV